MTRKFIHEAIVMVIVTVMDHPMGMVMDMVDMVGTVGTVGTVDTVDTVDTVVQVEAMVFMDMATVVTDIMMKTPNLGVGLIGL